MKVAIIAELIIDPDDKAREYFKNVKFEDMANLFVPLCNAIGAENAVVLNANVYECKGDELCDEEQSCECHIMENCDKVKPEDFPV